MICENLRRISRNIRKSLGAENPQIVFQFNLLTTAGERKTKREERAKGGSHDDCGS
jgi:hypothetical protein